MLCCGAMRLLLGFLLCGCAGDRPPPPSRAGYAELVRAERPAGFWPLDETAGERALDGSGHGRAGRYHGVLLGSAGIPGTGAAASFEGGHVELPVDLAGAGDFTFEAWVKLRSFAPAAMGCGNFTYCDAVLLAVGEPGDLVAAISANGPAPTLTLQGETTRGRPLVADGGLDGWQHLAFVRRGDRAELFVNGELAVSAPLTRPAAPPRGPRRSLGLGGPPESPLPFIGSMQDVALHERALPAEALRAHAAYYLAAAAEPPWVRAWRFVAGR